ncbi:MAG: PilZ domain-containing protein [Hoeflea sp.]|nr:PilZ domain-containing protein [Hoeflea sp.]
MRPAGNYLTRLAGEDQRKDERRQANASGTVYFLRHGVRGYASQPCRLTDISESGCRICGLLPSQVPEFLYLVLDGLDIKFPCAVVARSDAGLHLKFMANLPTAMVDRIALPKLRPKNPTGRS